MVRDYIEDTEGLEVFDLYSGTGTIAQLLAPVAKEVIGVEIVEDAVAAARENAVLNGLENCRFLAGDVLKILDEVEEKPDVIVLDPPREGIHPKPCRRSSPTGWTVLCMSPARRPALPGIWRASSQRDTAWRRRAAWTSSAKPSGWRLCAS